MRLQDRRRHPSVRMAEARQGPPLDANLHDLDEGSQRVPHHNIVVIPGDFVRDLTDAGAEVATAGLEEIADEGGGQSVWARGGSGASVSEG